MPFYQGKKEFGLRFLHNATTWTTKTSKTSVKGDILMSVRAPVDNINENPFNEICIGRGLAAIRVNDKVDKIYFTVSESSCNHHKNVKSQIPAMNDVINRKREISRTLLRLKALEVKKEAVLRKYL